MEKPNKHIFLCASFRVNGIPQGVCDKAGGVTLIQYLQEELSDRGLHDVSCLTVCDRGPVMVVYPENTWYGGINTEDDIDVILDAMEEDEVCDDYVIS